MGIPGTTELLIIAGVVILLFGAKKLPQLGGAVGESIKNFKKGVKDDKNKLSEKKDTENTENKSEESPS